MADAEREELARDIWKSGSTNPELLAEYLIRQGWGKRHPAFFQGVVQTVNAVNAMQAQPAIMKDFLR